MDVMFVCPSCKQQLQADSTMAGSTITCPACQAQIIIPAPDPANTLAPNPSQASAAAKEEKHFAVPVTESPTQSLIQKALPPLEAQKSGGDKQMRIKCIKRTDCVEVGKDHFDEVVSKVLADIGEQYVISINTLSYTHIDMGSRQVLTDYGVMIVYKG
jgi:DNA-directed RNA polymerase subunit RPC12/RpoP